MAAAAITAPPWQSLPAVRFGVTSCHLSSSSWRWQPQYFLNIISDMQLKALTAISRRIDLCFMTADQSSVHSLWLLKGHQLTVHGL
jgi:hypothetical protein